MNPMMVYLSVTFPRSAINILVNCEGGPLSLRARYAAIGDRERVLLGGITSVFGIREAQYPSLFTSNQLVSHLAGMLIRHCEVI